MPVRAPSYSSYLSSAFYATYLCRLFCELELTLLVGTQDRAFSWCQYFATIDSHFAYFDSPGQRLAPSSFPSLALQGNELLHFAPWLLELMCLCTAAHETFPIHIRWSRYASLRDEMWDSICRIFFLSTYCCDYNK